MSDALTRGIEHGERSHGGVLVTLLAVTATLTSTGISILAGWARGGSTMERVAWVFVGLVLLLSAHLIPALTKGLDAARRAPAMIIWAGAMLATGYGHATFFVVAQHDAGAARAQLVPVQPSPVGLGAGGRSQGLIAADTATIDQQLAALDAQKCRDACTYLTYRRKTLQGRRAALEFEMQDAKRRYALEDEARAARVKTEAQLESAMADPVSALLSRVFGVNVSAINLWLSVFLGCLMESVACLAWSLALPFSVRKTRRAALDDAGERPISTFEAGAVVASVGRATGSAVERPEIVSAAPAANDDHATTITPAEPICVDVTAVSADAGAADDSVRAEAREVAATAAPVAGPAIPVHIASANSAACARGPSPADLDRLEAAISTGEVETSVSSIRSFLGCTETQAQEIKWAYCRRPIRGLAAGQAVGAQALA
ncbi:hypothetical protein [Paraburkholderia youngii]|uniref:hypothetical protein n=1 Tax=Paraburkholderia youngii TaxID=2782701 RepID=UPI003D1DC0DC